MTQQIPCAVSVMVFTLNEEVNLPHCLSSLQWCDDVVIVDSGSVDRTKEIAIQANAGFYVHEFEGFGKQRNWALKNITTKHDWILILDADERVPDDLAVEINSLVNHQPEIGAARVRRRFYLWGRWLKYSSLYPTWVVRLVHKNRVQYINRGHAETQAVEGDIVALANDLIDENHKGIEYWFERQRKYALEDARYELQQQNQTIHWKSLFSTNPLTQKMALKKLSWKLPCRDLVYFFYSFVWRQGFRDGRYGFRFCRMRSQYQSMVVENKRMLKRENISL